MSYDRKTAGSGPMTLGVDGIAIDLSTADYTVPDPVKGVVVTAAGNVVCRPLNATADITLTDLPAGYVLPWHCQKIVRSGTTAGLATVNG